MEASCVEQFELSEIKDLMDHIDLVDKRIIALLKVRIGLSFDMDVAKKQLGVNCNDVNLRHIKLRTYRSLAVKYDIDPDIVESVFKALV
jgi:chorismate mutase